jgi:PAS domain S-box-containing protein
MERQDLEQWKAKEVARLLALVETERRYYQEMVAMLPVALVVLTADRHISSANRAFRHTFGLRSSDLRGRTIEQILPSDRLIEKIREVHQSGAPETGLSLEHEGRPLTVAVVPIRNWDDESEIETLLMVQEAVAAVPQVIEKIVEVPAAPVYDSLASIPAIVWEADRATLEFRSVRGDVEPLLGFPAAHWTETPKFFEDRIHPEDRAATMKLYRSATADVSAEFRAVTAAGGTLWVRETIRSHNGSLTGVLTSVEQRRQLEDQLLRAGRAEALQGNASKLAHDLNNPLMIVTGYAEEMRSGMREDDPMRGDVDEILAATGRISTITAQLLQYTRRQANPGSSLDVAQALANMEEKIAQAVGEGVAIHLSGERVWAVADAAQFEEVILALVSHDREDSRERSHLSIGCGAETIEEQISGSTLAPGVYTRVAIHDDGRGFEESKRKAAFDTFFSKPGEKNAGPGLAKAYAIVREWGGDIAFFSEPFRGSTFLIYLPNAAAPEPEAVVEPVVEAPAEPVVPKPVIPEPVLRETILLVEDEAGIRALVRKILRRENYNVLEAGSAEEAMTMAATMPGEIHLLVTDVMLPNLSGRDLAEHLRGARPDLKVLYVSGYTDDDAVRTGVIPPGSKFLQKPFTLGALVGKVKESLEAGAGHLTGNEVRS